MKQSSSWKWANCLLKPYKSIRHIKCYIKKQFCSSKFSNVLIFSSFEIISLKLDGFSQMHTLPLTFHNFRTRARSNLNFLQVVEDTSAERCWNVFRKSLLKFAVISLKKESFPQMQSSIYLSLTSQPGQVATWFFKGRRRHWTLKVLKWSSKSSDVLIFSNFANISLKMDGFPQMHSSL